MGMSASQARLLFISSRISDLELKSQQISNTKIRLADESEQVANDYARALNKTRLMITNPLDQTKTPLSYNTIMSPTGQMSGAYNLQTADGKVVVSSNIASAFSSARNVSEFLKNMSVEKSDNSAAAEEYRQASAEYTEAQRNTKSFLDSKNLSVNSDGSLKFPTTTKKTEVPTDDSGTSGAGGAGSTSGTSGTTNNQSNVNTTDSTSSAGGTGSTSGTSGSGSSTNVPTVDSSASDNSGNYSTTGTSTSGGGGGGVYTDDDNNSAGGGPRRAAARTSTGGSSTTTTRTTGGTTTATRGGTTTATRGGTRTTRDGTTTATRGGTRTTRDGTTTTTRGGTTTATRGGTTGGTATETVTTTESSSSAGGTGGTSGTGTKTETVTTTESSSSAGGTGGTGGTGTKTEIVDVYTDAQKKELQSNYDILINLEQDKYENYMDAKKAYENSGNSSNPLTSNDESYYTNLYNNMRSNGYQEYSSNALNNSEYLQIQLEQGNWYIGKKTEDGKYSQTSISSNTLLTEEVDSTEVAKAEAEYNAKTNKINKKEKILDMQLKEVDTEHQALTTEHESVKSLIKDNIGKTFNMFS